MVQLLLVIISKVFDCIFCDGGYYIVWDFFIMIIECYFDVMCVVWVDVVELGFWFLCNEGFKGVCVYIIDYFICSFVIFEGLVLVVMFNGVDFLGEMGLEVVL